MSDQPKHCRTIENSIVSGDGVECNQQNRNKIHEKMLNVLIKAKEWEQAKINDNYDEQINDFVNDQSISDIIDLTEISTRIENHQKISFQQSIDGISEVGRRPETEISQICCIDKGEDDLSASTLIDTSGNRSSQEGKQYSKGVSERTNVTDEIVPKKGVSESTNVTNEILSLGEVSEGMKIPNDDIIFQSVVFVQPNEQLMIVDNELREHFQNCTGSSQNKHLTEKVVFPDVDGLQHSQMYMTHH